MLVMALILAAASLIPALGDAPFAVFAPDGVVRDAVVDSDGVELLCNAT